MTILFRSDGSITQRGFRAYYSSFLSSGSTTGKSRAILCSLPRPKHKLFLKGLLTAPDTYGHPSLWPHGEAFCLGDIFLDRTATRLLPENSFFA